MKLYPFSEVAVNAERQIAAGATIYQQWQCASCGVKQTMPDPNAFYTKGKCEECGKETNIANNGCNFMATMSNKDEAEFRNWLKEFLGNPDDQKNYKKNSEKK